MELFDISSEILSNEVLDNLIQQCTSAHNLNSLLALKRRRILDGTCEKIPFSINCVYQNTVNSDLATCILRNTLFVASNKTSLVEKTIIYCLDNLSNQDPNEVFYHINLLTVVLEDYRDDKNHLEFIHKGHERFQDGVLTIIKSSLKSSITFILLHTLPSYIEVCEKKHVEILLTSLFNFINTNKKLELMCVCFENFLNEKFNALKIDDFWLLLMDCLVDHQHYLRKQANYLLSRSIEVVLNTPNESYPQCVCFQNKDEMKKIWENYLILLEVSNEKQLHIVEPSFCLFSSISKLNFSWRRCLYKLFLNHSQNAVVYAIAALILQTESNWENFSKISTEFLSAINKNEYTTDSVKIFKQLGQLSSSLDTNELNTFLTDSLDIPWVPAAIWGFYSNIFKTITKSIPLALLHKMMKKLNLIPHKFIRHGCAKIILEFFVNYCSVDSLNDAFKILLLLADCDESLFKRFLTFNEEKFRRWSDDLCFKFCSSESNLQEVELAVKILQFLNVEIRVDTNNLFHLVLLDVPQRDVERYFLNTLDSVKALDHLTNLLRLNGKKLYSSKLTEKASEILLKTNGNKFQRVLAFAILSKDSGSNSKYLINLWKNEFREDERIAPFIVKILLKSANVVETEEIVNILHDILDCQSTTSALIIFENVGNILQSLDEPAMVPFLQKCSSVFLSLTKTGGGSKAVTRTVLCQLFHSKWLQSNEFCQNLFEFSVNLLDISNSANGVAFILSENVVTFIAESPERGCTFVPLIVELILHRIVVNKNERVDYHVCQEIGDSLRISNNPNYEEISARLWAFESLLILVSWETSSGKMADEFVSVLTRRYMNHFGKRYFPDSQTHLEKLRILQSLFLLQKFVTDQKPHLVDFLIDSFIQETHQPSVRHLMQCLLILLTKDRTKTIVNLINEKLKDIDNNRPSTVSGLIPVLYHLVASADESQWDQLVEVLLPYTMGAQFKLRIFSQVALMKIYEKAMDQNHTRFLEKYRLIYDSIANVVNATASNNFDVRNIHHEFLDYLTLEKCDFSTIFYTIPKCTGVAEIEWENLLSCSSHLKHLKFSHTITDQLPTLPAPKNEIQATHNIQKKITPWKDWLEVDTNEGNTDFILVTSLIEKPANLGGLSRTCEVFGIKRMVMRTSKITTDREFKSLSMSSEHWVDVTEVKTEDLRTFILEIQQKGYSVIGAEQTSESVSLEKFHFPKRTVLVLGNEKEGIPADLIPLFDNCIEIPQFGMVRSLNVHVAGAIVMWEYCKQQKL